VSETRYILDHVNHDDLVGEPGGGGVGPWVVFVPDSGWLNSTLRYRLVPGGLQFEGTVFGPLPAHALARIGILPVGYRPQRPQRHTVVVSVSLSFAWGLLETREDGGVFTWWDEADANSGVTVGVVMALD
jgi:hypothetical protein